MVSTVKTNFNWSCKNTWNRSAKNTAWCLLGCAIGDFGTILFFQLTKIPFPVFGIMTLAVINGLITSIILETIVLMKQNLNFSKAFEKLRFCFIKTIVSRIILVIKPFITAKVIIPKTGKGILVN